MQDEETPLQKRLRRATWVALRIMPHEPQCRAWLRRARVTADEADDLVQEAYCRIAAIDDVDHIERPGAYFFSIVRNSLIRQRRAAAVVSLESIAAIEAVSDPDVSPQTEAANRLDIARIRSLMADLPERSRRIVEMRKIEGYSQAEIARLLGISESVVENNVHRGMKLILQKWRSMNDEAASRLRLFDSSSRDSTR